MRSEIFWIVAIFLMAGFLSAYSYGRRQNSAALSVARWMAGLTTILIVSTFISVLRLSQKWIPTNPGESHLLICGLLSFLGWAFSQRRMGSTVLLILNPLIFGILGFFQMVSIQESSVPLPNPWIWIHIVLMLVGETFFFVAAVVSGIYLMADYQMRHQRMRGVFTRITSLHDLDIFHGKVLLVGFVLLSAGMACGFMFAREFWQTGWIADPKVIFCGVTWILYGVILLSRWMSPLNLGRRSAWFSVIGLAGILFLAWGVESVFPTQHINYGSTIGTP